MAKRYTALTGYKPPLSSTGKYVDTSLVAQRLRELDLCMQENAERVRQLMANPDFRDEDLIKLWDQNTQRFNKLSQTMHLSKSIASQIFEKN